MGVMRVWVLLALVAACASCGEAGLPPGEPLPPPTDFMLTGAKITSWLSAIGAIVGEFFAGYGTEDFGLGYLIESVHPLGVSHAKSPLCKSSVRRMVGGLWTMADGG